MSDMERFTKRAGRVRCLQAVAAMILIAVCAACGRAQPQFRIVGQTMGTQYIVTVVGESARREAALRQVISAMLVDINAVMSTYDPDSEISRFNAHESTAWLVASPALHAVVATALDVARRSGGAFDITVAPLVDLWGFGPAGPRTEVPEPPAISELLPQIGIEKIALRSAPPALRKAHPAVRIDLSGIAKGYAVDQIAAMLEEQGIDNYLVDIGGELRGRGFNARGQRWQIGIENPATDGRDIAQTISLHDLSLAGSGNYRNYFELDGIRYGHTIDPRTGRPTQHALLGVSVLHESAMVADAWATAFMSMGVERGFIVAEREGLAVNFFVASADSLASRRTAAYDLVTANP